jgi:hypothetical protein
LLERALQYGFEAYWNFRLCAGQQAEKQASATIKVIGCDCGPGMVKVSLSFDRVRTMKNPGSDAASGVNFGRR